MKKYSIFIILAVFILSCKKESILEPSLKDINWFEIVDDPQDPLKHKAYNIYKEIGLPIFYNDLLGTENRGVDANGNPIIFEKRLDINYTISGSTVAPIQKQFVLLEDEKDIDAGLDFVKNNLFKTIPKTFFLYSVFLVDSLYEQQYAGGQKKTSLCHKGLNTFVIANIKDLSNMNDEEKLLFNNKLLTYLAINYISKESNEDIEKFQKVSYDPIKGWFYYGMAVQVPNYPGFKCLPPDKWEVYGFLDYDHAKYSNVKTEPDIKKWRYYLPSKEVDIEKYIEAVFNIPEDEFNTKYESHPLVISKYKLMKKILSDIGFSI